MVCYFKFHCSSERPFSLGLSLPLQQVNIALGLGCLKGQEALRRADRSRKAALSRPQRAQEQPSKTTSWGPSQGWMYLQHPPPGLSAGLKEENQLRIGKGSRNPIENGWFDVVFFFLQEIHAFPGSRRCEPRRQIAFGPMGLRAKRRSRRRQICGDPDQRNGRRYREAQPTRPQEEQSLRTCPTQL